MGVNIRNYYFFTKIVRNIEHIFSSEFVTSITEFLFILNILLKTVKFKKTDILLFIKNIFLLKI